MNNQHRQPHFWKKQVELHAAREQNGGTGSAPPSKSPSQPIGSSQPSPPLETKKATKFGKKATTTPAFPVTVTQEVQKAVPVADKRPYERAPFPAPRLPALDCSIVASLSFFDKKGLLHIWPSSSRAKFIEWNAKWQVEFPKLPSLNPSRLKHGSPCVVKYSLDGKWYRATYLGIRDEKRQVFFEDYGTIEPVADTDFKEADPHGKIGYEMPTELYSCNLARPGSPQKYFVLEHYDDVIQKYLVSTSSKSKEAFFDFDIFAYRRYSIYGRDRTLLVVGMTSVGGLHFEDVLLKNHKDVGEAELHSPPITFASNPDERSCVDLHFLPPHPAPLNERILCFAVEYHPDESLLVVSYFPLQRDYWDQLSPAAKLIYGDASVLQSCEDTWTEGKASFVPTKAVTLGNSYLVEYQGRIRRIEVDEYAALDEHSVPIIAHCTLIDMGIYLTVECSKILDFPRVIAAEPAIQAFNVTVDFTRPGGMKVAEKGTRTPAASNLSNGRGLGLHAKLEPYSESSGSKQKRQFVGSVEQLRALVGTVVEMEAFQRNPGGEDLVRIYA